MSYSIFYIAQSQFADALLRALLQPPSAPPPLYMDNAIAAHATALQLPDSDQRRPLDCGGVRVEHRLLVVLLLRLVRLWQGLEEVVELDRLALRELGLG